MSTQYGQIIPVRDGKLRVEAYGATGVVKLQVDSGSTYIEVVLESAEAIDELVAALHMAQDHIWITPPSSASA